MRPESVEGTADLAKALIAQGNFADAVKILHEAADSSTKNPEVSATSQSLYRINNKRNNCSRRPCNIDM